MWVHRSSREGIFPRKGKAMTDRTDKSQGKKTGHQGRETIAALSDEDLAVKVAEFGVSTTNDDGTDRTREEIVNEVANKTRQAERGQPKGKDEAEVPEA